VRLWELALYEMVMFSVVQLHHANVALPSWVDRRLRVFIVTPFMHKVNHSRWQPETDSNYGSLFSFWDRLFRSFRLRAQPGTLEFGFEDFKVVKTIALLHFQSGKRSGCGPDAPENHRAALFKQAALRL
jgi:sterol desaturase/sphingolipid hydroxylase (fatty acid hydroxylase superfamily)